MPEHTEEQTYFVQAINAGYAVEVHGIGHEGMYWGEWEYVPASVGIVNSTSFQWEQWQRDMWELGDRVNADIELQKKHGVIATAFAPF